MNNRIYTLLFSLLFAILAVLFGSSAVSDLLHINPLESAIEAVFGILFYRASCSAYRNRNKYNDHKSI